ncbi:MAG: HlyD family type I secretion periplasmic adaptor subunit [Magnetococcales bacterium]|nr:HlyD family type I secretion periplasmic adaptor subunit [Magnetococcales bacterium]
MVLGNAKQNFSRYLSEALILEEEDISWKSRLKLMLVVAFIFSVFIWAIVTEVDEAVKTTGQFQPTGSVHSVQAPEGGILAKLLVSEGQLVEEGQELLRLSNATTLSEKKQIQARQAALRARAVRLEAFVRGEEPDFSAIGAEFVDVVREQKVLWHTQNEARKSNLWLIDTQIAQKKAEVALIGEQIRQARARSGVDDQLLSLREELGRKDLVSRMAQLNAQRDVVSSQGEIQRLGKQLEKARKSLGEVETRRQAMEADLRHKASDELGTVKGELEQVEEQVTKLENRSTHLILHARVRGRVQDLRMRTIGGVVKPGDVLLQIVPSDEPLQLELRILPKDIGFVKPGQSVVIKVASYDSERYGTIKGRLLTVSPFTQLEADKKVYYRGYAALEKQYVGNIPGANPILPGMAAQADVVTGSRSLLAYLVKPLVPDPRPEPAGTAIPSMTRKSPVN